uniref:Uncharacterized protein n=1 Tax=viral metagenome TaxID=1070528 RepID=A0A6C0F8W4_9ZZZZ
MSSTTINGDSIIFNNNNGDIIGKIKAEKLTNHAIVGNASVISFEGTTTNDVMSISRTHEIPINLNIDASGNIDINLASGNQFHITVDTNITNVNLINQKIGQNGNIVFIYTQNIVGSNVTWTNNQGTIAWANNSIPTLNNSNGEYDIVSFNCIYSNIIYANFNTTIATTTTVPNNTIYYTSQIPTSTSDTEYIVHSPDNEPNTKLFLNQIESPNLVFVRNSTYTFDISYESNSSFAFNFSLSNDSSNIYTNGITVNGTPGTTGAYITFTVPVDAPDLLYYIDLNRSNAGNYITITWPGARYHSSANEFVLGYNTNWEINNQVISSSIAISRKVLYKFDQSHIKFTGTSLSLVDIDGKDLTNYIETTGTPGIDGILSFYVPSYKYASNTVNMVVDGVTIGSLSLESPTNSDNIIIDKSLPLVNTSNILSTLPVNPLITNIDSILLHQLTNNATDSISGIDSVTIDTSNINWTTTGTNNVLVNIKDNAQNTYTFNHAISINSYIIKDVTNPVISIDGLASSSSAGAYELYEIHDNLLSNISVSDLNYTSLPVTISSDINPTVAGTYTVTFTCADILNNIQTVTHAYEIYEIVIPSSYRIYVDSNSANRPTVTYNNTTYQCATYDRDFFGVNHAFQNYDNYYYNGNTWNTPLQNLDNPGEEYILIGKHYSDLPEFGIDFGQQHSIFGYWVYNVIDLTTPLPDATTSYPYVDPINHMYNYSFYAHFQSVSSVPGELASDWNFILYQTMNGGNNRFIYGIDYTSTNTIAITGSDDSAITTSSSNNHYHILSNNIDFDLTVYNKLCLVVNKFDGEERISLFLNGVKEFDSSDSAVGVGHNNIGGIPDKVTNCLSGYRNNSHLYPTSTFIFRDIGGTNYNTPVKVKDFRVFNQTLDDNTAIALTAS